MKKSNLIFTILVTLLFIVPVGVLFVYSYKPAGNKYTGFINDFRTVIIDNPALITSNININTTKASGFPAKEILQVDTRSYLFYSGIDKYLPQLTYQGDILMVGAPIDAGEDKDLTLHIHINNLEQIVLNGKTIWSK